MNHVTLMGRLTRDPEMSYLQSGKAFSKFTIAVENLTERKQILLTVLPGEKLLRQ